MKELQKISTSIVSLNEGAKLSLAKALSKPQTQQQKESIKKSTGVYTQYTEKRKNPKIINRGKITYYIYDEKVVVSVGCEQYISYNQYDNWNRQGINQFIDKLKKSEDGEYANVIDQMSLAVRCGIRGSSTTKPKEVEL